MRVVAFRDRGVLKFRVIRNGRVYGFLTLDGLVKWYQMQKPTTAATVVGFPMKSRSI